MPPKDGSGGNIITSSVITVLGMAADNDTVSSHVWGRNIFYDQVRTLLRNLTELQATEGILMLVLVVRYTHGYVEWPHPT